MPDGFKLGGVGSDGNCFWYSLAVALYGNQGDYQRVKNIVLNYVRAVPLTDADMNAYLLNGISTYLKERLSSLRLFAQADNADEKEKERLKTAMDIQAQMDEGSLNDPKDIKEAYIKLLLADDTADKAWAGHQEIIFAARALRRDIGILRESRSAADGGDLRGIPIERQGKRYICTFIESGIEEESVSSPIYIMFSGNHYDLIESQIDMDMYDLDDVSVLDSEFPFHSFDDDDINEYSDFLLPEKPIFSEEQREKFEHEFFGKSSSRDTGDNFRNISTRTTPKQWREWYESNTLPKEAIDGLPIFAEIKPAEKVEFVAKRRKQLYLCDDIQNAALASLCKEKRVNLSREVIKQINAELMEDTCDLNKLKGLCGIKAFNGYEQSAINEFQESNATIRQKIRQSRSDLLVCLEPEKSSINQEIRFYEFLLTLPYFSGPKDEEDVISELYFQFLWINPEDPENDNHDGIENFNAWMVTKGYMDEYDIGLVPSRYYRIVGDMPSLLKSPNLREEAIAGITKTLQDTVGKKEEGWFKRFDRVQLELDKALIANEDNFSKKIGLFKKGLEGHGKRSLDLAQRNLRPIEAMLDKVEIVLEYHKKVKEYLDECEKNIKDAEADTTLDAASKKALQQYKDEILAYQRTLESKEWEARINCYQGWKDELVAMRDAIDKRIGEGAAPTHYETAGKFKDLDSLDKSGSFGNISMLSESELKAYFTQSGAGLDVREGKPGLLIGGNIVDLKTEIDPTKTRYQGKLETLKNAAGPEQQVVALRASYYPKGNASNQCKMVAVSFVGIPTLVDVATGKRISGLPEEERKRLIDACEKVGAEKRYTIHTATRNVQLIKAEFNEKNPKHQALLLDQIVNGVMDSLLDYIEKKGHLPNASDPLPVSGTNPWAITQARCMIAILKKRFPEMAGSASTLIPGEPVEFVAKETSWSLFGKSAKSQTTIEMIENIDYQKSSPALKTFLDNLGKAEVAKKIDALEEVYISRKASSQVKGKGFAQKEERHVPDKIVDVAYMGLKGRGLGC